MQELLIETLADVLGIDMNDLTGLSQSQQLKLLEQRQMVAVQAIQ